MATAKRSSANGRKSAATRSGTASSASSKTSKRGQAAKAAPASHATKSRATKNAATNGADRRRNTNSQASAASKNGSARARGNANRRTASSQNGPRRQASARTRTAQAPDGVVESMKHAGVSALRAANRASGPTLTVAAAVAGIAGGLMLRQRPKPAIHDGLGARSRELLHDIDPSTVIQGIGRASMLVSQRSKALARDIDQVADRAEQLGKVLR
jgi:hypothetical protein